MAPSPGKQVLDLSLVILVFVVGCGCISDSAGLRFGLERGELVKGKGVAKGDGFDGYVNDFMGICKGLVIRDDVVKLGSDTDVISVRRMCGLIGRLDSSLEVDNWNMMRCDGYDCEGCGREYKKLVVMGCDCDVKKTKKSHMIKTRLCKIIKNTIHHSTNYHRDLYRRIPKLLTNHSFHLLLHSIENQFTKKQFSSTTIISNNFNQTNPSHPHTWKITNRQDNFISGTILPSYIRWRRSNSYISRGGQGLRFNLFFYRWRCRLEYNKINLYVYMYLITIHKLDFLVVKHPHTCSNELFYLFHLRSCAASAWGFCTNSSSNSQGILTFLAKILSLCKMIVQIFANCTYNFQKLLASSVGCACFWNLLHSSNIFEILLALFLIYRILNNWHIQKSICQLLSCICIYTLVYNTAPPELITFFMVDGFFFPSFPNNDFDDLEMYAHSSHTNIWQNRHRKSSGTRNYNNISDDDLLRSRTPPNLGGNAQNPEINESLRRNIFKENSDLEDVEMEPNLTEEMRNLLRGSNEVASEAMLRDLFGEDLEPAELLRQVMEDLPTKKQNGPYFCPINGCACKENRHPGFKSISVLRSHINLHTMGEFPGMPETKWLEDNNLKICPVCQCTASVRINNEIDSKCWPKYRRNDTKINCEDCHDMDQLPDMNEIFSTRAATREWFPNSLLPMLREEYGKLIANVLEYSDLDAFGNENQDQTWTDSPAKKRARKSWLELCMFPKAVLRSYKRGQRPLQAYNFSKTLIHRWAAGERSTLWEEIPNNSKKGSNGKNQDRQKILYEDVARLVSLNRAGQALNRLISPGLAANTPAVEAKLKAKFPEAQTNREKFRNAPKQSLEIEPELVLKKIKSFAIGKGPGGTGLRAEFLKQLVGSNEDEDSISIITSFVQFIADGKVPYGLRPWFSGGILIGGPKIGKSLEEDARPLVMGETWRKLAFKCTLQMDMQSIKQRIGSKQLAVGISSGGEAMIHSSRAWLEDNKDNQEAVLLQRDVENAFNAALPEEFIEDCINFAPASAPHVVACYGQPANLIYHDKIIKSCRGQQGCPMMGSLFCIMRKRMAIEARSNNNSDEDEDLYEPEYADDSFAGGKFQAVYNIFIQEINLAAKYGLRFNLSECRLYVPSGGRFSGNLKLFTDLGVQIRMDSNVSMLKVPIYGTDQFYEDFCKAKMDEIDKLFAAIVPIPQKHIALHLLRFCLNFSKVQYYLRTVPRNKINKLIDHFDGKMKEAVENILEERLNLQQWQQATLPVKQGGLGLRMATDIADIALTASHRTTREITIQLYPKIEQRQLSNDYIDCLARLKNIMPATSHSKIDDVHCSINQKEFTSLWEKNRRRSIIENADGTQGFRIECYSQSWADGWLRCVPSRTDDTLLSNGVVKNSLAMRLGSDLFEEGHACNECHMPMDTTGHHCMNCIKTGDKTIMHNGIRDIIYHEYRRVNHNAKIEPIGLIDEDHYRRPADTLLVQNSAIEQSDRTKYSNIALDFAVVSPFTVANLNHSSRTVLAAAKNYAQRKRSDRNTQQRCNDRNLGFEPIVFESTGGLEPEGAKVLESICKYIAARTERSNQSVIDRIKIKISILIQRSLHKSIEKRRQQATDHEYSNSDGPRMSKIL